MYADRVEAASKRSIKDRLNGASISDSSRRRPITGKRQRDDRKWEHDLFQDDEPGVSNGRKVDARDLRLKLQKKSLRQTASVARDLREMLSGTMHAQPVNADPPKLKSEAAKPAHHKSVAVEAPEPEIKKIASVATEKTQQKADTSVDTFLHSLGLEKYLITFQVEEVDMTALVHMTDEDLRALGIPMGPRKKILLALESGS